jgi:hypothetical protein
VDFRGMTALTVFMLLELSCVIAGVYLLRRPKDL